MADKAIITLRSKNTDFEEDLEIPVNLKIGKLKEILMEHLRLSAIRLYLEDEELKDINTPASYGLWDGSIILFE